jgi:hypothetical protein
MSKILQKNELGYGILIEQDAGYISSDLNKDILTEDFKPKIGEPILVNCILQKWGVENKNGRIYPKNILVPQVGQYQKLVENNQAYSEADHPSSSIISLQNISHMITKMWWGTGDQENVLFGQLKILVTRGYINYGICSVIGDKIYFYLENKMKIGISSRGVGSLKNIRGENIVQSDFELVGFDLVSSPSTPGAFLFFDEKTNNPIQTNEIYKKNENGIYLNEANKIETSLNKFLLN